ncbi:cyclodeaminase/cyclohydrolase family protein [Sporomusa silvacetica]|uniref:cyclodeaminase/cyclohydrolase family protein n=1 Tax=Sporomusa silvacetica TaxID=55504 RepID=UPI0035A0C188
MSAIEIPLKICACAAYIAALEPGSLLLPKVKKDVWGDLKIGLLVPKTGIVGSLAAARINLSLITEDKLVKELQFRIDELQISFDMVMTNLG